MKIRLLLIYALASILLASCAIEEVPMEGGSIAAVMEDIQTRTAVTDEGTFTWSAGDQVWLEITADPGYVTGTLSSGAGTGSANFAYGSHMGTRTGKAVYPFNSGHDVNGNELSVVLPASYDLGSNLSNTNAAMYGVETDGSIKFNHLAGVMRFKFRNVPVGTDKFILTLDKKINGTFSVDLTEEHPALQTKSTSDESERSITLNFDALTSVQDIMLYVPLPLGTYTTLGLEVKAGSQSVWTYSNTVTNTINRKSLLLMPTVTLAGSISGDIEGSETPDEPQDGDYVDEYGINHGQGVEIDGVVWAPVNCGYHATDYQYGKLYQWGRKYGQGYDSSDASVPSIVSGPVSLSVGQSESNTNKFYKSTSSPEDWITPQDDALWNSGTEDDPVKTEYDPCPEGWRVPTYAELNALKANKSSWTTEEGHSGYWFSGSASYSASVSRVFFPAAGDRSRSGDTGIRGGFGYYWSSGPFSNNAYLLYFGSNEIHMSNFVRAYGFSVRCVQDLSTSSTPADPIVVDLSSNGTANSYIVSESGSYSFSPTKGNSSESVGAISSVEVLWETFGTSETPSVGSLISSVSYADGKISFSTPQSYREGNAVIAAKDASGTILWSWHIWLTDEPEEQIYYNNAGTMMDRNLGAISATPGDEGVLGLLYQWGRKDPFLGSSSISSDVEAKSTITWPSAVQSNSSNGTINYATEQPTTFITSNSNNWDWYYTGSDSTDNTRWQSEKTIYDPCPSGWRVPDGGEDGVWAIAKGSSSYYTRSYDDMNKGMNFSGDFGSSSTIWYPVSGFRNGDGGLLFPAGYEGDYWSVTPSSSNYAYWLYFLSEGDIYLTGGCFRAYGLSVRCQKEGTGGGFKYDSAFPISAARSLSDAGTANSYIVSSAGTYSISAVKGNSSESVGSVASAEVLWETFGTDEEVNKGSLVSGAKYENSRIYFKTADAYREGNAVIAAKDASGNILWSWHIWLTDEPQGQVYYNNAGTMMDRNLGATSATPGDVGALGLLYQWGRKDPFLGSSSISNTTRAKSTITWPSVVSSTSSTGTIDYAIAHPTIFIIMCKNSCDWYYTTTLYSPDNTRWLSEKTIYDPCPVGWRVPDGGDNGVWSKALGSSFDFTDESLYNSTSKGMNFSGKFGDDSTIWYPATGSRGYGAGTFSGSGYFGYYWSVSPKYSNSYILFCGYSGNVYPSDYEGRASALAIRCVRIID